MLTYYLFPLDHLNELSQSCLWPLSLIYSLTHIRLMKPTMDTLLLYEPQCTFKLITLPSAIVLSILSLPSVQASVQNHFLNLIALWDQVIVNWQILAQFLTLQTLPPCARIGASEQIFYSCIFMCSGCWSCCTQLQCVHYCFQTCESELAPYTNRRGFIFILHSVRLKAK